MSDFEFGFLAGMVSALAGVGLGLWLLARLPR
jgi:hypothetical protein